MAPHYTPFPRLNPPTKLAGFAAPPGILKIEGKQQNRPALRRPFPCPREVLVHPGPSAARLASGRLAAQSVRCAGESVTRAGEFVAPAIDSRTCVTPSHALAIASFTPATDLTRHRSSGPVALASEAFPRRMRIIRACLANDCRSTGSLASIGSARANSLKTGQRHKPVPGGCPVLGLRSAPDVPSGPMPLGCESSACVTPSWQQKKGPSGEGPICLGSLVV
jgi:hypothetical protein